MEWIVLFIINWVIFLLLINWNKLKVNMWGGIFTAIMASLVDYYNTTVYNLYTLNDVVINIKGSSLFFLLGPTFVIGTLFAQYHPKQRWTTVINVVVITVLYSIIELLLVYRGIVEYHKWTYAHSLSVNLAAVVFLSWFCLFILNKIKYLR